MNDKKIEKIEFPLPMRLNELGGIEPTFDEIVLEKLNELIDAVNNLLPPNKGRKGRI